MKRIIEWFLNILPSSRYILFESCPDFSDNTMPVFKELVNRGYNKKYKFVWMCGDETFEKHPRIHNVKYLNVKKHSLLAFILKNMSRANICCNRVIASNKKKQLNVYLMHGSPIKDTSSYYRLPNKIDFVITEGEGIRELSALMLHCDINKAMPLGYPRNDILGCKANIDMVSLFGKYSKYIVWYPTVKQFKNGNNSTKVKPIPFMDEYESIIEINEYAKRCNVLIIIKPHFAQLTSVIKKQKMSNIVYIDDSFLKANNLISYQLLASSDALLTDYSSVFYDYLLLDKPIGFTWDDFNEFKNEPGLVEKYEMLTSCGKKIFSVVDFNDFFIDLIKRNDLFIKERRMVREYATTNDFNSTKRVVDFIIAKANL